MFKLYQPLSRRRTHRANGLAFRPGVEGLEVKSLLATCFPVGFVGPLPIGGYYEPSLTTSEYSEAAAPALATGVQPDVAVAYLRSNYDVPTLGAIIDAAPLLLFDPYGTVTYTTTAGQFDNELPDSLGIASNVTGSTFTATGDEIDCAEQIDNVLLLIPPDDSGYITITQSWTNPTPGSRNIRLPVTPYDDGAYEATLQDLKTLQGGLGASSNQASQATVALAPLAPPTGVRDGIDRNTLQRVRRDGATSTAPNGFQYVTTGYIWTVRTVLGATLTILEADPRSQQPQATRNLADFQDPSYNCHSYTFGGTNVVCPDGVTRSFEIINPADVTAILAAS
jgi:hypothetical protein